MEHRLAVIGVGSIGERHVRCFLATGRAHVVVVELNAQLRQAVAQRYQTAGFDSLGAALAERLTAAVVATPAPWHLPLARQCVESGLDVLIEKPLSTTSEGLEELVQSLHQSRRTAAVAYVYRSMPVLAALRQVVESGLCGRPLQLVAQCGQHFPTYRPAYRQIYYAQREQGGGAIQDALTHVINLGQWLLGPIDRLVADAAHLALPDVSVEDTVHVLARHGQTMACYALNQHQAPNEILLTLVGTAGTWRVELPAQRLLSMSQPGSAWDVQTFEPLDRDGPFVRQAHSFLDAVEGKSPPLCTLAEGAHTLFANLAILASSNRGTWQDVPPTRDRE